MRITPLRDKVLVALDPFDKYFEETGILRPEIAFDKPMKGTVQGRGPLSTLEPGTRVLVPWARGHDFGIGGRAHVMVSEFADSDIVAIIEEE